MARKKYYTKYYRRKESLGEVLFDIGSAVAALFLLGLFGWAYLHPVEAELYGSIAVILLIAGIIGFVYFKRHRGQKLAFGAFNDEQVLAILKGITPSQFENEIAKMFRLLGYTAEVTGGANDGGIDIVLTKGGKRYFVQCKKFMTREVTPHDVRDFLGAITNINNHADKGFFITTNGFTLMAEKAAEGNPRIELIDGYRLVQYYRMAYGNHYSESAFSTPEGHPPRICPQDGGTLEIRMAQKGPYAGRQFWGCSNFPVCNYIENIPDRVPTPQ
jgi:restriction system protein